MPSYFVMHPRSGTVAEVQNAGNTKHARTALLDYLSRKGTISWKDRQNIRKELKVVRGDTGEIETSVVLDYAGSVAPIQEITSSEDMGLPQVSAEASPTQIAQIPEPQSVAKEAKPVVKEEPYYTSSPPGGIPVLPSSESPISRVSKSFRARRA